MSSIRRVSLAASLGTVFEWYDFFVYGTASALVFPALFFPKNDATVGLLLSFAIYATGFFARPLGGVVAGHLGDRRGRKGTLTATLLLMGVGTFAIGLLPTYQTIGILAPILLVVLRLVQGFAGGGEWGGASLLTLEHAKQNRGFWCSFIGVSVYIGLIIGNLVYIVLGNFMSREMLLAWGWRIPFLLSAILVVVGLYLRLKVTESPQFTELRATDQRARRPLVEAFRNPRNVLAIFLMRIGQNTTFYILSVFCISYMTGTLKFGSNLTLTILMVGSAAAAIASPLWGALCDRVGFRPIMTASLIASIVIAFPLFAILDTKSLPFIFLAFIVAVAGVNASNEVTQPVFFSSMFGANIRYSGVSVGREGGTIIGGGLSPLIAVALLSWAGHWWAVAAWMALTSVAGLVGARIARPQRDESTAVLTSPADDNRMPVADGRPAVL